MKKFLVVLVALVATAAMVAPAFAEDRLSLGGEMRVRAWHIDDGAVDTQSWADQRLRIGGKLAVADGVSVTFRTDITEANWGGDHGAYEVSGDAGDFGNARSGSTQQWDRAHLDLTQGIFHLRAGQQYIAFGNTYTVDAQEGGLAADLKVGPGKITAFYFIDDDNGATASDATLAGAQFGMKNFSVFVANQSSRLDAKENAFVLGATMNLDLGAVALNAEADFFAGDAADNVDATGTQGTVGADFKASDVVSVGGEVYFALSNDKADETRYSYLGNGFGGWDPLFDIGTSLSNEKIGIGRAYDVFGDAGVVALRAKTSIKAGDAVKIGASAAYAMPEDDALTGYDSKILLAGGLVYNVMDNTSLQLQAEYILNDDVANTDDELQLGTGLFVKF